MTDIQAKLRCSLFQKYFLFLFAAAIAPLLVAGASEGWFGYRDQRSRLSDLLGAEARLAAAKIENLIDGMKDQLTPLVQLPWTEAPDDQHRIGDAIRLLRDAPAVLSITLLDRAGKERLHLSRVGLNRIESGADRSGDVAVVAARSARVWFGPVAFHGGSDASMTIAVAGDRAAAGVAMAEISLHLIWDLVSATRVGKTGQALILDAPGRLIAHPDRRIVLSSVDQLAAEPLRNLRTTIRETGGNAAKSPDAFGRAVIAPPLQRLGAAGAKGRMAEAGGLRGG